MEDSSCLIETVVVTEPKDVAHIKADIHWIGGQVTPIEVQRGRKGVHCNVTNPELVDLIRRCERCSRAFTGYPGRYRSHSEIRCSADARPLKPTSFFKTGSYGIFRSLAKRLDSYRKKSVPQRRTYPGLK